MAAQFRKDSKFFLRGSEAIHWSNHPEAIAWALRRASQLYDSRKRRAAREGLRCASCGTDIADLIDRVKFCSDACKRKSLTHRIAADPQRRLRRREAGRRAYRKTKRERPEVYRAAYRRKLANPLYRIAKAHRARIWDLVGRHKMIKDQSSLRYWGCTADFLRQHLASQFTGKMSWQNYGSVWEVDHKVALTRYDLRDPRQAAIAFNWQNLQPMLCPANASKSNKLTEPQQCLPLVMR